MSHFVEKCVCGVQLSTCRCPSKDKEVRISSKPCTHQSSQITTGEFPQCVNCNKQFIDKADSELCFKCRQNQPKKYKAMTLEPETPDPFNGYKTREVTGYYVKHITAQPNPINTPEGYNKFVREHTKHYIVENGWADWNMPTQMEFREIDVTTLKEIKDE